MEWIKLDIKDSWENSRVCSLWVSGTPSPSASHLHHTYDYPFRLYVMCDKIELCTQKPGHQLYLRKFNSNNAPTIAQIIEEVEGVILLNEL